MKSCVSGLAKNKTGNHIGYLAGFLFLLIVMISGQKACAAVTEGETGKTYSGEYVVIVNAGEAGTESTGTLTFTEGTETQSLTEGSGKADVATASLPYRLEEGMDGMAKNDTGNGFAVYGLTSYENGSQREFYTYYGYRTFTCIGSGEHCYIWMENSLKEAYDAAGKTEMIARDMIQTYEQGAYETLNELSGGNIPCRDGSGKLSIALEQISSASGVYMGKWNEPDITAIHIDTRAASNYTYGSMRTSNALLVHEGQHALFEQLTSYDYTQKYMGINEGLSVAAMEYAWGNSDTSNWLDYLAGNHAVQNGTSILYRSYRNQTAQDYGLPYLFMRYLINRKSGEYNPAAFFRAVYGVSAADKTAGTYLQVVMGGTASFADLVTDFYTAIAANEASGRFGFEGDAVVQSALNSYPYYVGGSGSEVDLEPTAGIILHLGNGGTFTVPSNGGNHIRYRIIGEKNSSLSPGTGSGTVEDPYQITTVKEWNQMANRPGGHYRLMNDLTVTGSTVTMIGTFSGELDGGGHTIIGLRQPICSNNKGIIRNLKVRAKVNGVARNDYGMIAQTNDGSIQNCMVSGNMNLIAYGDFSSVGTSTGGIVGRNNVAGVVQNCIVTARITISASAVKSKNGGIVGCNSGSVKKNYFRGNITVLQTDSTAEVYTGGIVGETNRDYGLGGRVAECLNEGGIRSEGGKAYTGQICGNVAQNIVNYGINNYIVSCYGKENGVPLIGSVAGENLSSSKTLTEDEWKSSSSFDGLDFGSDWNMGEDGPLPSGVESKKELGEPDEDEKNNGTGGNSGSNIGGNTSGNTNGNSGNDGNGNTEGNVAGKPGENGTETGGGAAGSSNGNTGQSDNAGQKPENSVGNSNAEVIGNGIAIPAIVKLNATTLPLQVKKSTTVLKIKEYSAGDAVASWSSSNKKVATVNARTGKITARKTGKTTITVTMRSGAAAKCLIKVQKGKVKTKKLNVGKTAITLKKGEKYRITWEKQPLTSSEKVTFQSTKKKIAVVSGKGVITAKKKGTTYITVKSGSKKRKIKVTVQ